MRADLPTGTVTFLFTDVEGSTQLLKEIGADAYADALEDHRRVIREACTARGGVEVDSQGDACFFVFPTAPDAVSGADDALGALAGGPISVRIGLHTGTALLTEGGYVGDDVHLAARISAAGHGGQALASAATAELARRPLTYLGEHRFKDFEDPVSVYQLGDARFPPLRTISNTNLPRPVSSFVGRETELGEVVRRIEGGARLVTLTGPGGTGKTRLAIEAATALVPSYRSGVFWVGLASIRDPELVTESIGQALGARNGIAGHVGEQQLLLLLDNLEHVVACAPELVSLLAACPNLTLLVTSREVLRVSGEVEYPVPPLASPEAVALFCDRSQLEPSADIESLCARLDSLPLAVELAAGRTKSLTPAQIMERLGERLDLLKGGRDADPRQQTLRATIEWSYELLDARERELFARLSVFAGGCTLAAAEDVCGADVDCIQSLIEKSLLRASDGRYWMLETIRDYADGRLTVSGNRDRVLERLGRHLVGLASSEGAPMFLGRQAEAFERLQPELDNVRAVIEWAVPGGRCDVVAELLSGFALVWNSLGHLTQAESWVDSALEARGMLSDDAWLLVLLSAEHVLRFGGDYERSQRLMEEALGITGTVDEPWLEAMVLTELCDIAMVTQDFETARGYAERSLVLRRERGISPARALFSLGDIALRTGDFGAAETLLTDARTSFLELGHAVNIAYVTEMLGEVAHARGDFADAERWLADALRQGLDLGDEAFVGECLKDLAVVEVDRGKARRAAMLWTMGIELWRRAGSPAVVRGRDLGDIPELEGVDADGVTLEEAVAYALASID